MVSFFEPEECSRKLSKNLLIIFKAQLSVSKVMKLVSRELSNVFLKIEKVSGNLRLEKKYNDKAGRVVIEKLL